jgi:hypothetical protein
MVMRKKGVGVPRERVGLCPQEEEACEKRA